MFTSSYFQFRGAGRIGISRGIPRGVPAGFRRYAPLTPGEWLWTAEAENQSTYRNLYFSQLSTLDPARVIADLYRLAGDCAVPTLLCFCNLGRPDAWCHRRMAAEWIEDKTALRVVELSPNDVRKIQKNEQSDLGL